MAAELFCIMAGFGTGVVVGMTGIGGGALMTPILIFLIGVAPTTAVGTDLLFATVTKLVAVRLHRAHGTIDWQVVRRARLEEAPPPMGPAGALGTVMLVYLYPLRLTPARLIGTDLAHAIPVALLLVLIGVRILA